MRNQVILIAKALLSTAVLILLHLLLINVLGLWIEGWNAAVLSEVEHAYLLPVFLINTNLSGGLLMD